jgi:precorrin-2 dehydrogenase / sirohydrochlorin ferrochelatase
MNSLFPIFLKLEGQRVLVVGAGAFAEPKVQALLQAGAVIDVVAPRARPRIAELAHRGDIRWRQRTFQPGDANSKTVVFAATGLSDVDRWVFAQCRRQGVLCNAIDDPEYCDFYSPAVVRRGDLQIAISTNGQSPALAQQLRQELEKQFETDWDNWVAELGHRRRHILSTMSASEERNRLLHQMASETMTLTSKHFEDRIESADLRDVAKRLARNRSAKAATTDPLEGEPTGIPEHCASENRASALPDPHPQPFNGHAGLVTRVSKAVLDWLNQDEDKVALI